MFVHGFRCSQHLTPLSTSVLVPPVVISRTCLQDDEKLQEVLERKVTQALEEGGVLDQLVEGLAVMEEEERGNMVQMFEAAVPRVKRQEHCGWEGYD